MVVEQKVMQKQGKNLTFFNKVIKSIVSEAIFLTSDFSSQERTFHLINYNTSTSLFFVKKVNLRLRKNFSKRAMRATVLKRLRNFNLYLNFSSILNFGFSKICRLGKEKLSRQVKSFFSDNIYLIKKRSGFSPVFFKFSLKYTQYITAYKRFRKLMFLKAGRKEFNNPFSNIWKRRKITKVLYLRNNLLGGLMSYRYILEFFMFLVKKNLVEKDYYFKRFYLFFLKNNNKIYSALNLSKFFNCYLKKVYNNIFFTLTSYSGSVLLTCSARTVKLSKNFRHKFKRKSPSIFFTVLPYFIFKLVGKFSFIRKIETFFFYNIFGIFIKKKLLAEFSKQNIAIKSIKNIAPTSHGSFIFSKKQRRC